MKVIIDIPDNATNRDVLKALFLNIEIKHDVSFGGFMESNWIECDGIDITNKEWLNTLYKRVDTSDISTCKDCNLYCKDRAIDGACFCSSFHTYTGYDFYCADFEKRG